MYPEAPVCGVLLLQQIVCGTHVACMYHLLIVIMQAKSYFRCPYAPTIPVVRYRTVVETMISGIWVVLSTVIVEL